MGEPLSDVWTYSVELSGALWEVDIPGIVDAAHELLSAAAYIIPSAAGAIPGLNVASWDDTGARDDLVLAWGQTLTVNEVNPVSWEGSFLLPVGRELIVYCDTNAGDQFSFIEFVVSGRVR